MEIGFPNAEKFELIEGELIDGMDKKHLHLLSQNLPQEWVRQVVGSEYVRSESLTDLAEVTTSTAGRTPT